MHRSFLSKCLNITSVSVVYTLTLVIVFFSFKTVIAQNNYPALSDVAAEMYSPEFEIKKQEFKKEILSGYPDSIFIEAVNIDKPIEAGIYDTATNSWNVGPKSVHYAELTAPVNESKGSTLLYGHNNKNVFGPLKKLNVGDKAVIRTKNDLQFTYELTKSVDTSPLDVSIFSYDGPPILTLQTCSGINNEIRTLHIFNLIKVDKL